MMCVGSKKWHGWAWVALVLTHLRLEPVHGVFIDANKHNFTEWPNLSETGGFVTQFTLDELTSIQRMEQSTASGATEVEEEHPCGLLPSEAASASLSWSREESLQTTERMCELASRLGPRLDSRQTWRVCLLPVSPPRARGPRAFHLIEQGLKLHPAVVNVPLKDIRTADFVVWLPGSTTLPPSSVDCPPHRLIVVDYADSAQPLPMAQDPAAYGIYFKQSWVTRQYEGEKRTVSTSPHGKKRAYFPISYSIAEEFLLSSTAEDPTSSAPRDWPPVTFPTSTADIFDGFTRDLRVVCSLRRNPFGSPNDVRTKVRQWVADASKKWKIQPFVAGQVDNGNREIIQNGNYLDVSFAKKACDSSVQRDYVCMFFATFWTAQCLLPFFVA
jgi:hypothetical protein